MKFRFNWKLSLGILLVFILCFGIFLFMRNREIFDNDSIALTCFNFSDGGTFKGTKITRKVSCKDDNDCLGKKMRDFCSPNFLNLMKCPSRFMCKAGICHQKCGFN